MVDRDPAELLPLTPPAFHVLLALAGRELHGYGIRRDVERRTGVRLLPAMMGAAGLTIAQEQRPALILLDLHLPDMYGEDILASLRDDPRTAGIPVLRSMT